MKCIFCQSDRSPSEEHIIPESIGGGTNVTVHNVCHKCNNKLGTEADALLTRHRHIYDAYRQQLLDGGIDNLTFFFDEAYITSKDNKKVKLRKKNTDRRIVPTKLGESFFRIDLNDQEFVPNKLRRMGKEEGILSTTIEVWVQNYLDWMKQETSENETFQIPEIGLKITNRFDHTGRRTIMKGTTPHRYVAKTCVEIAYALNIENEVLNLEQLREHAINGGLENCLEFKENMFDQAQPFHFLSFTDYQFQVYFFGKYGAGVAIEWKGKPLTGCLAFDIKQNKLFICDIDREAQTMTVTDDEFVLPST